jgi:hypothetical protein
MTGLPCLCSCDLQLGCNEIPRSRLTQSLARARPHTVACRLAQRRGVELQALPEHHQQPSEALERWRLDATLDPADRVLAGPGSQRKAPLAYPLSGSRFA